MGAQVKQLQRFIPTLRVEDVMRYVQRNRYGGCLMIIKE